MFIRKVKIHNFKCYRDSQYIFNKEAVDEYIVSLGTVPIALPYITIEIFLGGDENPLMNGDSIK